jgi:hypothetical protein
MAWGHRTVIDFELPQNVVPAALALVLGVLAGAGGMWHFTAESTPDTDLARMGEMEGVLEQKLDRELAPEDTAGQEEADVRVRFKRDTVRTVDSVLVPIPSSLSNTPQLSSASSIEVTEDRVTWTHFDPAEQEYRQDVFDVPGDPLSFRAHVLARAWAPARNISLSAERVQVGVGVGVRWRRLSVALNGLTTPSLSRQRVEVGLRWRLSGSP